MWEGERRTWTGTLCAQLERSGRNSGLVGSAQHHQSSPRTIRKCRSWNDPGACSRSSRSWASMSEGIHHRKAAPVAVFLRARTTTSSCAAHSHLQHRTVNSARLSAQRGRQVQHTMQMTHCGNVIPNQNYVPCKKHHHQADVHDLLEVDALVTCNFTRGQHLFYAECTSIQGERCCVKRA